MNPLLNFINDDEFELSGESGEISQSDSALNCGFLQQPLKFSLNRDQIRRAVEMQRLTYSSAIAELKMKLNEAKANLSEEMEANLNLREKNEKLRTILRVLKTKYDKNKKTSEENSIKFEKAIFYI